MSEYDKDQAVTISAETLRVVESSAEHMRAGVISEAIDLSEFDLVQE